MANMSLSRPSVARLATPLGDVLGAILRSQRVTRSPGVDISSSALLRVKNRK